jgi:hypothetical protein
MFGRLFGVILATLLDRRPGTLEKISQTSNGLQSLIGELLDRLAPSRIPSEEKSPPSIRLPDPAIDDCAEGRCEREERDLLELKRQLCEKSKFPPELSDRSVDLIHRSTSLFERGADCSYHVCPFRNRPVFEGLICHLGKCCGGNPHEKGIICATGTPYDGSSCYQPPNVADLQTDSFFHSKNETGQWLCYDFKAMRVAVTHYILRSHNYQVNGYHLRSWVLEGSEDGSKWTEIDGRDNDSSLNGPKAIGTFEVRTVIESRTIIISWNSPGSWTYLRPQSLELFRSFRFPVTGPVQIVGWFDVKVTCTWI